MTKALLTEKDIKTFILKQITKITTKKQIYLTRRAICLRLGIDVRKFEKALVKKGLKYSFIKSKTKYYDLNKVILFALEQGVPVQNITKGNN